MSSHIDPLSIHLQVVELQEYAALFGRCIITNAATYHLCKDAPRHRMVPVDVLSLDTWPEAQSSLFSCSSSVDNVVFTSSSSNLISNGSSSSLSPLTRCMSKNLSFSPSKTMSFLTLERDDSEIVFECADTIEVQEDEWMYTLQVVMQCSTVQCSAAPAALLCYSVQRTAAQSWGVEVQDAYPCPVPTPLSSQRFRLPHVCMLKMLRTEL